MLLRDAQPRPRSRWREPRYPVAAAVVFLLFPGCSSRTSALVPRTASASECIASPPGAASKLGLDDARSAPPFYADDPESRLREVTVAGLIAAPYEEEIGDDDARRIEARMDYCVRASRERGAIPRTQLGLEAWIDSSGKARCVRVTTLPERADLATCVRALVESATFSASSTRTARATWTIGPEPRVAR